MRWERAMLVAGLVVAGAAMQAVFADDAADAAFESAAVKELGAKADELKVDDQLALMKHVQRSLTAKLLTPSEESWRGFETLKGRGDAGVARILERGLFDGLVTPRGGGCYWSFTKRSNDYDKTPQVELQQWSFSSGFHGGDTGLVARLERAELLTMTESVVPDELRAAPDAVAASRGDRRYSRVKAEAGGVYAVRAVDWEDPPPRASYREELAARPRDAARGPVSACASGRRTSSGSATRSSRRACRRR